MFPDKLPPLSRRALLLLLAAVGLIALLLVGPHLVDAYVNWLWFGEVGFRSVWVTVLLTRVAIFVAVALVGGTVFLALMLAYRSRPVFVPAARPTHWSACPETLNKLPASGQPSMQHFEVCTSWSNGRLGSTAPQSRNKAPHSGMAML
jgi:hypothetical protein